MEIQELVDFAEWTVSWDGGKGFYRSDDMEKRVMASTMKLTEEAGELTEEILGKLGLQRKAKEWQYNDQTLADEFADMILVTIRLARMMDIDIQTALGDKMKKIKERVG